jgi:dihydropteroate synthase
MPKPLGLTLMGVINVTPDSFSDGGAFFDPAKAIAQGRRLLAEGARILDIGGESTRPGARPLPADEEQRRILPVITALAADAAAQAALISVDTRNASTMRAAVAAGARIVNDISALTHDPDSLSVVRDQRCAVILMHMQGTPETMQEAPAYDDVVEEVYQWLKARAEIAIEGGIGRDKILVDPGIGFGKTVDHNLLLLRNLKRFKDLGFPLVLGVSRKGFIGMLSAPDTTPLEAKNRLAGSLAAGLFGSLQGVDILRVHDVAETAQALRMWQSLAG